MEPSQRSEYAFFVPITVRWGEMDALGHVNNTIFYRYSEDGRIEYFQKIGADRPSAEATGPILADLRCRFVRQLHYPADIEIGTRTARIGNSSLIVRQGLFPKDGDDLIADFNAVVVWFDYGQQTKTPVPDEVRDRIRAIEAVAPEA